MEEEKSKSQKLKEKIGRYEKLLKETKRKYAMADFDECRKLLKEKNLSWEDLKNLIRGVKND